MVLIDSHTISKSIDNDDKVDDIFDSITDIDHTRNPKLRRDRFIHKFRPDYKDEYVKPVESLKETKQFTEAEKTTARLVTTIRATPTEHTRHHKSPKRRVGSFWRKFRGKDKKAKNHEGKERKRRIPKNKDYKSKYPAAKGFQHSNPRNKNKKHNRNKFLLRHTSNFAKRDLSQRVVFANTENKPLNKLQIGIAPQLEMVKHHPYRVKTIQQPITTENIDRVLATMTTQITRLKELYGIGKYSPTSFSSVTPMYDKPPEPKMKTNTRTTTTTTTSSTEKVTENEYPGTQQIEELLNDIKLKAIQMVAEQNPAVTDIISNTVTEATFEADPILTHIEQAAPAFYLGSFVSLNDMSNMNEKRTVSPAGTNEFNLNDSVLLMNTEAHILVSRSIKEDTMTMARNVEDMLQKKLKKVYHKVKNKVSSDFNKEVHKVKSTIKEGLNKISSKIMPKNKPTCKPCKPPTPKPTCREAVRSTTPTSAPRHTRGDDVMKYGANNDQENPTPTYDDYMMLTLYEQMLAKTHEDNVRKMLSTADSLVKKRADSPVKKRREKRCRLSKRNPETLTDVELREDVNKLYDDGVNMPEYDYIEPSSSSQPTDNFPDTAEVDPTGTMGSSSTTSSTTMNEVTDGQNKDTQPFPTSDSSLSDTSYEGLSNKISYNDFVNGYRHYLKFQKEQDNQNFSNLIRYQAHRHHSVDDIGKYILNKIPPLPSKRRRSFFDDSDFDYQEISTKSDDSWFRKHFYLFIDNGPPKKFHTSQTVELKSPMTEPELKLYISQPPPIAKPGPNDHIFIKIGSDEPTTTRSGKDTGPMSLDDLTRILESIKGKQSTSSLYHGLTRSLKDSLASTSHYNATESINLKMLPHNLMDKLFGNKHRRTPKKVPKITEYYYPFDMSYVTASLQKRGRRTVAKDETTTMAEDFISKDFEEKPSTIAKESYGDAALRNNNKETNKYGYIDIDLVPRQTAVVKLRENKTKKNRIKEFFKKFHFKKNKDKKKIKNKGKDKDKDKKQVKRYCDYISYYTRRKARFNPIKKLRDIFRGSDDKDQLVQSFQLPNMPDYEMMTSQIESFKPIKYDKMMSIDEMQKQIPNISDISNYDAIIKHTTKVSSYLFKLDDNDRNLLYNYPLSHSSSIAPFTPNIISTTPPLLPSTHSTTLSTTTPRRTTTTAKIYRHKLPASNVMTINLKTIKTSPPPPQTTKTPVNIKNTVSAPLMTLEDMGVVLNKIQLKLAESNRDFPRFSTPFQKRGTMTYGRKKIPVQMKKPFEELTIKSKLTRIAKFPITNRNFKVSRREDQPHVNRGNDHLNLLKKEPMIRDYIHALRNRNVTPERKIISNNYGNNMRKPTADLLTRFNLSEKCRYTDYFNDLLMWHNDVLNLDKVPNPLWKNILKNIESESDIYTTPSMSNLMNELNEMKDFLDDDTLRLNRLMATQTHQTQNTTTKKKTTITTTTTTTAKNKEKVNAGSRNLPKVKQGVIKSVAMNDNTIVTSKNLLIKGEAKYYQYNKPKFVDSLLKSSDFITKLYKLNVFEKNSDRNSLKGKSHRSKVSPSDNDEQAILVDTTLMAYDDDMDFFTQGLEVKKLSRNSQKSASSKTAKKPYQPFMKVNKAPMQYYTTPLPMKSHEFEKFLKEHKMDVESVTSPMVDLPSFNWTDKTSKHSYVPKTELRPVIETTTTKYTKTTNKLNKQNNAKITQESMAVDKTMKTSSKSKTSPPTIQRNVGNKRNRFIDDFDRYKRYSELNKLPRNFVAFSPGKTTQELKYYNILKKKIKLFEKKASAGLGKTTTDTFTLDPRNKEVEITIINFDDIDKLTTFKGFDPYSPNALKKQKEDTPPIFPYFEERNDSTDASTKPVEETSTKEDAVHNELLYKNVFKERTTTTSESNPMTYANSTIYVDPTPTEATPELNKLKYPFDFLNKIQHGKHMNVPKRVHISSHHYKYDIFYNDEKKPKPKMTGYRPKLSLDPTFIDNDNRIVKVATHHRRFSTIFRNYHERTEVKKIDKTGKRNRHARHATASAGSHRHKLFTRRGCKPKAEGGLHSDDHISSAATASTASTEPEDNIVSISTVKRLVKGTASNVSETAAEAPPVSFVYDLKHLKRTSTVPLKERRRRLFKISSLLQDRFKHMRRNGTSKAPGATATGTNRHAKSDYPCVNLKCNCTCRAQETETTTDSLEDLKGDGFRITCRPDPANHEHKTTTTTTPPPTTEEIRTTTPTERTYVRPATKGHNKSCHLKHKGHVIHELPNDTLYMEPDTYNDQAYYEMGPLQQPPTTPVPCPDDDELNEKEHMDIKRDLQLQQHNVFTAKDVAALEVIVDLMKHTLSYEEKDIASVFNNNFIQSHATKSDLANDTTNSIQVHIAIPFDIQNGKKRSPLDPVRVRKVFSAKMSTPVDLEYQVHSFEGTVDSTTAPPRNRTTPTTKRITHSILSSIDGLSPGMYLLVDKPKSGYALKPVKGTLSLSDLKTRQVPTETTASMTEAKPTETRDMETTNVKSLTKVTLSKDFIAAVNKHLIELYENMTSVTEDAEQKKRKSRSAWMSRKVTEKHAEPTQKSNDKNYIHKRRIDWEAVKKYFGHDRVCSCKCKANKAMCRACAASDAVIDELIFEFDNIGRYMRDHCTEIQTFFWMNPGGGLKLRESVSRIDKSLEDYYKRVKGKCQGRPCKTFSTYVDKRQIVQTFKIPKEDVVTHLLNDLAALADDLNKTISLKACFNHKLKEEGEKFLRALNSCVTKKAIDKRSLSNTTKKKLIKNVYSLDNINVNIICNPEVQVTSPSSTSSSIAAPIASPIAAITMLPTTEMDSTTMSISTMAHLESTPRISEQLFDNYILEESKVKKRKGLKKLFPRKNKKDKLFTYYTTDQAKKSRFHFKRDVEDIFVTPLISDVGGAFWFDYLKGTTFEPRIVRDSKKNKEKKKTKFDFSVLHKGKVGTKAHSVTDSKKKMSTVNTICMTVKTSKKNVVQRDTEPTTDYLTHNIHQLLQLFGSLQDIESMNMHSNRSTMFLTPTTSKNERKCTQTVKTTIHYKYATPKPGPADNMTTEDKLPELPTPAPADSTETKITGTTTPKPTARLVPDSSVATSFAADSSTTASTTIVPQDTLVNVTNTKPNSPTPTQSLPEVSKIVKVLTAIAHTADTNLRQHFTPPTPDFFGKLKTASLRFFGKNCGNTTINHERISSSIVDRISNTEISFAEFGDSSEVTTDMSPTIVIINEYDNQISRDLLRDPNKDSDGYRNLLLSIIQYETNRLNDEWHKIAYGTERDDGDFKRSVVMDFAQTETTKPKKCKTKPPPTTEDYDLMKTLKSCVKSCEKNYQKACDLEIPDPDPEQSSKKKCEGILNKLASKFGMKVVAAKKKQAVKKPTLREVPNRRRLRKRKGKTKSGMTTPMHLREACDSRGTSKPSEICDIQATYKHITDLQKNTPFDVFENLVKNISCFKYKTVDNNFYIRYKRQGRRWDWIRNKRSLKLRFVRVKDDENDEADVANFNNDNDFFESFVKGDNGIYKVIKRRKRTVGLKALDIGLRNIPPLIPGDNELYVMTGDTITFDCLPVLQSSDPLDNQIIWRTDRQSMMEQDNVKVDGPTVTIHNVEPRNVGNYVCSQDKTVKRNVKVSVVTIPAFDVVFLPLYKTEQTCSYDDLRAIQHLSGLMAERSGCGNVCSVRIDEPVCLKDRGTNRSMIRATAVISMASLPLNCSVQCRRDIVSSLVMLSAANTPSLTSAEVVMSKDGVNETLSPCKDVARHVVTHTLRKKDSNGHREYHKLVSGLSPGKVDVVLICPAGYYLMPELKICVACPANTWSVCGDNSCSACPRGTRSAPGAARCSPTALNKQPRRYDWWWYPSCGYVVAFSVVVCGCAVCAVIAAVVHEVTRDPAHIETGDEHRNKSAPTRCGSVTAAYANVRRAQPLSPSRVILARFFKPSLTSSRATDSQETKFELWKERNIAPPLPPIDFDF